MGYDGWVTDFVTTVPASSERQFSQLVARVSADLFGSAYKAYVSGLESEPAAAPGLDVRIGPDDLHRWLLDDGALLVPVLGGDSVPTTAVLMKGAYGVYHSPAPGLVVWALPRAGSLADHRREARIFSLESDVIAGALASGDTLLVVGRERQVSVDVLPPLRFEMLALLDTVHDDELAQSFERDSLFAGTLENGWDWAPIHLSSSLVDTEFGSLLNLADQLLKSWSCNGEIRYWNFGYPDPAQFPFPRPIPEYLDFASSGVVFNWNTEGMVAAAEIGSHTLLWTTGTGAMPIKYLPDGGEASSGLPAMTLLGWQRFASSGDPLLARVTQYTTFFHITRALREHPDRTPVAAGPDAGRDVLEREAADVLKRIAVATDEQLQEAANRAFTTAGQKGTPSQAYYESLESTANLVSLRDELDSLAHADLDGIDQEGLYAKIAAWLIAPREEFLRIEKAWNKNEDEVRATVAADVLAFTLAQALRQYTDELRYFADPARISRAFAAARQARPEHTIRTPSIVLSRTTGSMHSYTGGHNVGSQVIHLSREHGGEVVASASATGRPVLRSDLSQVTLVPGDFPRFGEATPSRSMALALGEHDFPRSRRGFDVATEIEPALGSKQRDQGLGWVPGRLGGAGGAGSGCGGNCIQLRYADGGYQLTAPDGRTVVLSSPAAMQDALASLNVRSLRDRTTFVAVEGMTQSDIFVFLDSADLRRTGVSFLGGDVPLQPTVQLGERFNLRKPKLESVTVAQRDDGSAVTRLIVSLPNKELRGGSDRGLRLTMRTEQTPKPTQGTAIKRAVKRAFKDTVEDTDSLAADLANELRDELQGIANIQAFQLEVMEGGVIVRIPSADSALTARRPSSVESL